MTVMRGLISCPLTQDIASMVKASITDRTENNDLPAMLKAAQTECEPPKLLQRRRHCARK